MITVKEGEKRDIRAEVEQVSGTGAWVVTNQQRRILDSTRAVVAAFDWAACTWDSVALEMYWLFDSTVAGLLTPGTYHVQFRCTIGTELYECEVTVQVVEVGP